MDSVNIFTDGMNSDMSKLNQSNKQYVKGLNVRPITTLGGSNGSLNNIAGNACEITFPRVRGVYKCKLNAGISPGVMTITINGITTNSFNVDSSTTANEILTQIKLLANCYTGTYSTGKTFTAVINDDYIFIYQNPEYRDCDTISSDEPDISTTVTSDIDLEFVNPNGSVSITPVHYVEDNDINDNLVVIGSTTILENSYILTCAENNTNSTGQIWELSHDDSTGQSVLKLLYHNKLAFNKNYPVAPSAAIGRYEVPTIQRITWSDFNNPIRTVNVKDPNLMGLGVTFVDLVPSIQMSIPTYQSVITGGATKPLNSNATYQCAYRLRKTNGALSNFSTPSNLVYLVDKDTNIYKATTPNYGSLAGDANTINKAIQWRIEGIDTAYDVIEFYIIYRDATLVDVYSIYKYDESSIFGQTGISTTFINDTATMEQIPMEEFLITGTSFTHAKTIEEKDNRLFFGNVKNSLGEYINNFDTRTYRFKTSSDEIKVKQYETDTTPTITNLTDYTTQLEIYDNIPSINLGMESADDVCWDAGYKFQKNSTMIGGEGPNIKYTFGTVLLQSDEQANFPTGVQQPGQTDPSFRDVVNSPANTYDHGYRRAGSGTKISSYTSGSPAQNYYFDRVRETMGLEPFGANFKSYQHNEIYRFGILFKSKAGAKYFVKWVGDIKFPNYDDTISDVNLRGIAEDGSRVTDFRSMYYSNGVAYCNIPFVEFEVNIPEELAAQIDGYEIVRVERKDGDRTIPAHGLITQVMGQDGGDGYNPLPHTSLPGGLYSMDPDTWDGISSWYGEAKSDTIAFHSFNYLVDKHNVSITNGDKIIVTEKYGVTNGWSVYGGSAVWPYTTSSPPHFTLNPLNALYYSTQFFLKKFYQNNSFVYNNIGGANSALSIFNVLGAAYADTNDDVLLPGISTTFHNRDYVLNAATKSYSYGSPVHAISIDTGVRGINWSAYNGGSTITNTTNGFSKLLAVHFKPARMKSQYGGRRYFDRTQNEYISCGAFYKVDNSGTAKLKVFGGDIFHGVLDIQKAIKNFDMVGSTKYEINNVQQSCSQTWFFPTQSTKNIDLRLGTKVSTDLNASGGAETMDSYFMYQGYGLENTLNKYIAKPAEFNETDSFYNRVYYSEAKFNGETINTWATIPFNNYHDVDGNYGPINCLVTFKNMMYAIQNSGFCVLNINPVSIIQDQNGTNINLGTGQTLEKHNYLSTNIGTKHQWSISKSIFGITFVDSRHKKIYMFNGQSIEPVSDIKGSKGFMNKVMYGDILTNDNPIIGKGIVTTYDFVNNEFLYSFHNNSDKYTLVFSEPINAFSSFYSAVPYIYINNGLHLRSLKDYTTNVNKVYMHNVGNYGEFYDEVFKSSVKVNVNPNPAYTKLFDNLSWITESTNIWNEHQDLINDAVIDYASLPMLNDTFSRVRCYNEYQNTDWVTLDSTPTTGNVRRLEQGYNIQVPRNRVNYDANGINSKSIFDPTMLTKTSFGERLRDKNLFVDLEYDNTMNNRLVIHNLKASYKISDR